MDMKFLSLFEAFESDALSKILKFLGAKIPKSDKLFVSKLKQIMTIYDLPLSKISNDTLKYVARNQALRISLKEPVLNSFGIHCIKFWFSLETGYLGFTGTGNTTIDFESFLKGKVETKKAVADEFGEKELDYIRKNLRIETGILTPVTDYSKLKLGDKIIGYFSKVKDLERLGAARIWFDVDKNGHDRIKAIQNVSKGKDPKEEERNGIKWREWGEYSWGIGRAGKPAPDAICIHHYQPSDKPLRLSSQKERTEKSPLDFNLPINQDGTISNWTKNWSIPSFKVIDQADFSIVLFIDDIMKSSPSIRQIKTKRVESKAGAIKFLKDEEIKKINIKRYLEETISRMGIKKDITELKDLQKILLRCFCGDFGYISLYKGAPSIDYIQDFISKIRNLLTNKNEAALKEFVALFQDLNVTNKDYQKKYFDSYKFITQNGSRPQQELFSIMIRIGEKIKNHLLEQNIQTLEDLKIFYYKIRSIKTFVSDVDFAVSDETNVLLQDFHRPDRIVARIPEFRRSTYAKDIQKLKHIEKYCDSVLK